MRIEENNLGAGGSGGIYIEKQVRGPSFTMDYEHFHSYCEIFYLKTGSCIYTVNGVQYHLSSGDLFIVAPGDSHSTRYEGLIPCERIIVCCKPEVLPAFYWERHPDLKNDLMRSGKVILVKKGRVQVENLLFRMLEENNIPGEYSYEFLLLQTMLLFLSIKRDGIFVYEQIRPDDSISMDIERALRYIAENFALPLTLEEVAGKVNLSPTYFSKKFKKVTSLNFKEYVNYIRIRQASQMLLTTDDSITKIATNCGFNSSNYFKDCFHRMNGVSPHNFRKRASATKNIRKV